jgi:osmotically-inducible protein OsmY
MRNVAMNVLTTTKSKRMRDVAASARDWISSEGVSAAKDAKESAESSVKEARRATREASRTARKQMVRARVAAARATASRPQVGGKKTAVAAGATGAVGAYFLDPQSGARRRHKTRDQVEATVRRITSKVRREKDYRVHQAEGKVEALKSKARPEKPAANDQQLAERVKSELFKPADAPKGSVNINVEHGVVYLRGQVKRPGQIKELAKQARSIDGVRGVQNLLTR